jgi:hypothetical protein
MFGPDEESGWGLREKELLQDLTAVCGAEHAKTVMRILREYGLITYNFDGPNVKIGKYTRSYTEAERSGGPAVHILHEEAKRNSVNGPIQGAAVDIPIDHDSDDPRCTCSPCPPDVDSMFWRQDEEAACERRWEYNSRRKG